MSRALRLTPQNLGAKSEIAARADSLCRPARCSFLKKQAKNFSFALWSGGLRRACAKGWRTSAAQCLCSRIALWSGELALTLVQEAGARARRRRRKVFAVRLQDVLAFFQKAGRVWDRVPRSRGCKGRRSRLPARSALDGAHRAPAPLPSPTPKKGRRMSPSWGGTEPGVLLVERAGWVPPRPLPGLSPAFSPAGSVSAERCPPGTSAVRPVRCFSSTGCAG